MYDKFSTPTRRAPRPPGPTRAHRRLAAAVAAATAIGAASIGLGARPASAALTTRCIGIGSDVTVPGDLLVPAHGSCLLSGVRVDGSVRVAKGADLVLDTSSSVGGDVRVMPGAFVDAHESTVDGSLVGRSVFAVSVDATAIGGDLRFVSSGDELAGPASVLVEHSFVTGAVVARSGEISIESTRIGSDVTATDTTFFDLVDSTVEGRLEVRRSEFGTFVCSSEILDDAEFVANQYAVQVGRGGPLGTCDASTFWGGDLVVRDNVTTGLGVVVTDNIVIGSLRGSGNSPAPVGEGNRARGGVSGQFTELEPPAHRHDPKVAEPASGKLATADADWMSAEVAIETRRVTATAAAHAAGRADI